MESVQIAFVHVLKDLKILMGAAISNRDGIPGNSRFNSGPKLKRWPLALFAYPIFPYNEDTGSHMVLEGQELVAPRWDETPKLTDFPPAGEGYPSKVHGIFVEDKFGIFTFDRASSRGAVDQPKRTGPLYRVPYKQGTICFSITEFISRNSGGLLRCVSPRLPEGIKAEGGPETPRLGGATGAQPEQRPAEPETPPVVQATRIPAGHASRFLPEDRVMDSVPWKFSTKQINMNLGLRPPDFDRKAFKKDKQKGDSLRQNPSAWRNKLFFSFVPGDIRIQALTVEQGFEDGTRWEKKVAPFSMAGQSTTHGDTSSSAAILENTAAYFNRQIVVV